VFFQDILDPKAKATRFELQIALLEQGIDCGSLTRATLPTLTKDVQSCLDFNKGANPFKPTRLPEKVLKKLLVLEKCEKPKAKNKSKSTEQRKGPCGYGVKPNNEQLVRARTKLQHMHIHTQQNVA
jgi:hypothetical protein